MGAHLRVHLGVYIQIPYAITETTEKKWGCTYKTCIKSKPLYLTKENSAQFCTNCGHQMGYQDVPTTRRSAYRFSELESEHEDEFTILDGAEIVSRGPGCDYEYLLPNTDKGAVYPTLDDSDSGVYPYGPNEQFADIEKFGEEYHKLWGKIKAQWPQAKILQGMVLYHN